ncbi:hypothetical protein N9L68_00630 [bacterium]|nr:hypothetical protein [bacterium]
MLWPQDVTAASLPQRLPVLLGRGCRAGTPWWFGHSIGGGTHQAYKSSGGELPPSSGWVAYEYDVELRTVRVQRQGTAVEVTRVTPPDPQVQSSTGAEASGEAPGEGSVAADDPALGAGARVEAKQGPDSAESEPRATQGKTRLRDAISRAKVTGAEAQATAEAASRASTAVAEGAARIAEVAGKDLAPMVLQEQRQSKRR